ncbi:MAG: N-6 DNA methylase, partial [Staphylothermus sp.]|nr:N-6 DNA methylase [Staphylothermus sp.]
MTEKPTERTYVGELSKVISSIGEHIGFDAEVERNSPSGYPDVVIYYNGEPVAVIEVKKPEVPLSDPKLNEQALEYAEWYRKNKGVKLYGIHNMRYLKLFKYVAKPESKKPTLFDLEKSSGIWVPASDFPFKIMPWVSSITDYKQIKTNRTARENVKRFLLNLKEILEGKTLDLSKEVIDTLRELIEEGASRGIGQLESLYKKEAETKDLVNRWIRERGYEKPKSDNKLRELLKLLLKEQIYTFTMKLMFYLVLQSIDEEMAAKLKESIKPLEDPEDSGFFKEIADKLFEYAIKKTGDFEEIFGLNTVDRLPFVPASLSQLRDIVRYLNQIRWSEISVDVIGRVFEGLIYEERRHLLGQHYTDTKIVDLILTGVFRKECRPDKLLDPSCGSGTFLVRALNYWKIMYSTKLSELETPIYEYVEGVDIDRLASMLAKINLYIQALEEIKKGYEYVPKIYHYDFFKIGLTPDYMYVVTNPPYTRQEEMSMAYYARNYKKNLSKVVEDIEGWSQKASIYAYFLVGAAKLLRERGRLGFIIENSWLNAEYGKALKRWLFNNFRVEYVMESLVEKWFKDADVITNIIIAEKTREPDYITRFIFLKKPLSELIGEPPPATDFIANERYYEKISTIYEDANEYQLSNKEKYAIYESSSMRVVLLKKSFITLIEDKIGRLGIVKGPEDYLDLIFNFVEGNEDRMVLLGDVIDIRYGIKTNANEIFYLPSKHWSYIKDDNQYLTLKRGNKVLNISKKYLRRLIRPAHLENVPYGIVSIPSLKKEDYVLWVEDKTKVDDPGTREYIEWAENLIKEEYTTSGKFPTIYKSLESPFWLRFSDTSQSLLIFRSAIHKNYCIWLNLMESAQVDKRLYLGYLKDEYRDKISPETLFAVVNSVLTYMGMELTGRANLGEGALDIVILDYEAIPIVNPLWLERYLKERGVFDDFLEVVQKMLRLRPSDIEIEARRKERMEMEKFVLGPLG